VLATTRSGMSELRHVAPVPTLDELGADAENAAGLGADARALFRTLERVNRVMPASRPVSIGREGLDG